MKKITCFLLTLLLLLCMATCVFATQTEDSAYIYDDAGLLSDEEYLMLQTRAAEISEQYDCGVYIVLVDDYENYVYGGIEDFSEYIYESLGTNDCVMLALSMNNRDFDLMAHGYGNTAFTDYGKQWLQEQFLDNFRSDDWYGGLTDYLSGAQSMLAQAEAGSPLDVNNAPPTEVSTGNRVFGVVIVVLLSALVALVVCLICKSGMKSVRKGHDASTYLAGGVKLTRKVDRFTHSTQVVRQINQSNSGSGGTTVNSGGFSHSSGKF